MDKTISAERNPADGSVCHHVDVGFGRTELLTFRRATVAGANLIEAGEIGDAAGRVFRGLIRCISGCVRDDAVRRLALDTSFDAAWMTRRPSIPAI